MTQAEMVMRDRNMAKFILAPSPSGSMRSAAVRQVNMMSLGANFWPKNSSTWFRVRVRVRVRVKVRVRVRVRVTVSPDPNPDQVGLVVPLLAAYSRELGGGPRFTGVLQASYGLTQLLGANLLGGLSDTL